MLSNVETLQVLAMHAGVELPSNNVLTQEAMQERSAKSKLMEDASLYFQHKLSSPEGKRDMAYMHEVRGFSHDEIKQMELGSLRDIKAFVHHLQSKGYTRKEIEAAGLLTKGFGTTHTVVIPLKDAVGAVKGFTLRSLLSQRELDNNDKKYKYNIGIKLDSLFNIHAASPTEPLVVMEGYLDVLNCSVKGISNVVALGGGHLTDTQLQHALKLGYSRFILLFDNDKAGEKGTVNAIHKILKAGATAFVAGPLDTRYV